METSNCSHLKDKFTINIIDTLECLYINYNKEHNDKIKEILESIDIDTFIHPTLLDVSESDRKIITEKFGTEFSTVEYSKLIKDISDYLQYNKSIKDIEEQQKKIEKMYKNKSEIEITNIFNEIPKLKREGKLERKIEGYSSNKESYMRAGDYRLCSIDNIELNDNENDLIVSKNELNCYILYMCNTCVVLENENYNIKSLLETFTEIKMVDNCVLTPFKEFLHKRVFNSFSECESLYKNLKSTLPKETCDILIENQVKNYINWNYQITDNISDRIKVFDLYNSCKNEYKCTIDSRQFSKILLNLNLKKKRYQDGIYYYGLRRIEKKCIQDNFFDGLLREDRDPIKQDEHIELFNKICETRETLIKEFKTTDKMEQGDRFYKKVIQYMRSLPNDHPDKSKFVLEQAAIRMGYPFTSYLVNLQEPNWQEN